MTEDKPDRLRCCVPFCRRTFKKGPDDDGSGEVMCGKHWRAIPLATREAHKRLKRRDRRVARLLMRTEIRRRRLTCERAGQVDRLSDLFDLAAARIWEKCKAQAVEAAGGVT